LRWLARQHAADSFWSELCGSSDDAQGVSLGTHGGNPRVTFSERVRKGSDASGQITLELTTHGARLIPDSNGQDVRVVPVRVAE